MKKNTFSDQFKYEYSVSNTNDLNRFIVNVDNGTPFPEVYRVLAKNRTDAIERIQTYLRDVENKRKRIAAITSRRHGKTQSFALSELARRALFEGPNFWNKKTSVQLPRSDVTYISQRGAEGGVTIGWKRGVKGNDCRTIEVAVAYCAKEDTFNTRTGELLVSKRFDEGKTIKLPINLDEVHDIHQYLTGMFWLIPVTQRAVK